MVNKGSGTIGEYNASTGATINDDFISGLDSPSGGIALDGKGDLFVSDVGNDQISEFNASTGANVNRSLITGILPNGIAVDGSGQLFVADFGNNVVDEFDASTGAQIGAGPFISGLDDPQFIAFVPEPSALVLAGLAAVSLLGGTRLRTGSIRC